jgi:hypothetical protein
MIFAKMAMASFFYHKQYKHYIDTEVSIVIQYNTLKPKMYGMGYSRNPLYAYLRTQRAKRLAFRKGQKKGKRQALNALRAFGPSFGKGGASSISMFGQTSDRALPDQKRARRAFNYRGDGAYFDKNPYIAAGLRNFGEWAGHGLSAYTGVPMLGTVGRHGAGLVSKWLGFGNYAQPTSGNQIMDASQVPITVNSSSDETGDVYISHSEFVMNVTATATAAGSTSFQQTQIPLNPGLSTSFPFLSQIAQNFELYDFQGLIFQYKPTSGESGAASNSLGKIMMATNYDPDAAPFLNSVQMENYDYACSTKPALGLMHGVETAQKQQVVNLMYVRTGTSAKDKTFTDIGTFTIATEGIPASVAGTQIIGELWVTYRIKLSRANLYNSLLGLAINSDYFYGDCSNTALVSTINRSTANSNVWALSASASANELVLTATNPQLSIGCFMYSLVIYTYTGDASAFIYLSDTYTNNTNNIDTGAVGMVANKVASETTMVKTGFFKIVNTNANTAAQIRLRTNSALPSNAYRYRLWVQQIPCSYDNGQITT